MRMNRHLCLAMLLVGALSTWAPTTVAAPDMAASSSLGWAASWWQGAATWLVERVPFVGLVAAASEDDETTVAPGDPELLEGDGSGSEPLSLGEVTGGESESGPHWDPNG